MINHALSALNIAQANAIYTPLKANHAEASVSLNDYLDLINSGNTQALQDLGKKSAA